MDAGNRLLFKFFSSVIAITTACSPNPDSGSGWDGLVHDSAGHEIVINFGSPVWDSTDRWSLSEALRIGVAEGDPEYMFGLISDVAVLSDGRVVVADAMAQHLRYYHPDGRWEKTVGQAGSGPGEFGSFGLSILLVPGDTLLVDDLQNRRMNRIAPDGTWIDSWASSLPESEWNVIAWDYSPKGRIVSHITPIPGVETDDSETLDFVVLRGVSGSMGDTVASVPSGKTTQVIGGRAEYHLWAGEPVSSLCPDNSILTGRQDRYEIRRFGPAGDLQQVIRLDRESLPITESDGDLILQRNREAYLRFGYFTPPQVDNILSAFHFTATYPAFATLRCGPRGTIWIQPWRPASSLGEDEWDEPILLGSDLEAAARFDVFDEDGRYLGVIPLPPGFWPFRIHGDQILGRWRDSLEIDYVKIMRLRGMLPRAEG